MTRQKSRRVFLKSYTTSPIPIVQLDNMYLYDIEEGEEIKDNEKASIIAERDENGGWTISNSRSYGDKNIIYQDLSFEQMMEKLLKTEDIYFTESPYNEIEELKVFYPHEQGYIPVQEELNLLKSYINHNNLPHNHICRLALQIGEDKMINDRIKEVIERRHPHPVSAAGAYGTKMFFN